MKLIKILKERSVQLLSDERGQSTVEYILMLSAVVMIALKFKKTFGSKMENMVDKLSTDIDSNMSVNSP